MTARVRIGTSSWSWKEWVGPFYPPGTPSGEYLAEYAKRFDCVETDMTYYRVPSPRLTRGWAERLPDGFTMAAKFPSSICHGGDSAKPDPEHLLDLDRTAADRNDFLAAMAELGPKCGPLVLQFPYFNKAAFSRPAPFFERLDRFLSALPPDFRYGVEIRNRTWIGPAFLEILRRHSAAFVLVDQAWMPHGDELPARLSPATTDFAYVRLLGDRQEIEAITTTWADEVIDRSARLARWAAVIRRIGGEVREVFAFANNHYAGHAPSTVRRLRGMLDQANETT